MKKSLLLLCMGACMLSANATTVVDINIDANAKWLDYSSTEGWFQIYAEGSQWAASVSNVYSLLNEGTFPKSELDMGYTYLYQYTSGDWEEIDFDDVTATLTHEGSLVKCVATFVCNATDTQYNVTMVHDPNAPVPMSYDTNSDVEMHFELSDITSCEYDPSWEDVWFIATNADLETVVLDITVSAPDDITVIPAGEYIVTDDYAYGTIAQSPGYDGTYVYPSYLGIRNANGALTQIWWIEDGSCTVKQVVIEGETKLYMELNATNSYGKTLHATIGTDPTVTGLNKVEAGKKISAKALIDGKVVIRHNDKNLNVVGAEM